MTSLQNDEELILENSDAVEVSNENVGDTASSDLNNSESESSDPAQEKKERDDINDFVFAVPHRRRSHSSHSSSKSSHHHHHRHRKRKMKTWKKVLLISLCSLLALVILVVGIVGIMLFKGSNEMMKYEGVITAPEDVISQDDGQYVVYNGNTYELNKNMTNILFMGIDKRDLVETDIKGYGGQADVLVLISIDTKTGKITLINISRDTMTDVTVYSANGGYVGTEVEQICLSYAYGDGKEKSCENTVNAVRHLFYNIPINCYVALDLDGINAVTDSIGGVDVVSPETIGPFVEGESYHLEGDLTETFVRKRRMDVTDANALRMERQKVYVNALIDTLIAQTKQNIMTPVDLFNASSPYTVTNLNPSKVTYLAQVALTGGDMSIEMKSVPGEITMGERYAEFYVDETAFYEMFLDTYYNKMN